MLVINNNYTIGKTSAVAQKSEVTTDKLENQTVLVNVAAISGPSIARLSGTKPLTAGLLSASHLAQPCSSATSGTNSHLAADATLQGERKADRYSSKRRRIIRLHSDDEDYRDNDRGDNERSDNVGGDGECQDGERENGEVDDYKNDSDEDCDIENESEITLKRKVSSLVIILYNVNKEQHFESCKSKAKLYKVVKERRYVLVFSWGCLVLFCNICANSRILIFFLNSTAVVLQGCKNTSISPRVSGIRWLSAL